MPTTSKTCYCLLLELLEGHYDTASTVFYTQYAEKDWHQHLGRGIHADAIMDRIMHNTIWVETGSYNTIRVETGSYNMRELAANISA